MKMQEPRWHGLGTLETPIVPAPGRKAPRPHARIRRLLTGGVAIVALALGSDIPSATEASPLTIHAEATRTGHLTDAKPASPAAVQPASRPAGVDAASKATRGQSIDAALDAAINGIIDANGQYQIGVALMDLSDVVPQQDLALQNAIHRYGVQDPFEAASTAKVLAAAAYYRRVEDGTASLDDLLGDYTSGYQIKEMIQNSDNDAWSSIMDAVGYPQLQDYAASIGVAYDPEANDLTPAELATILAKLYTGKLLNQEHTAQLLSYMQDTNFETLIPDAVPAGITVYHKYGLLDGELHDTAILARGTRAYALVVCTNSGDESDTAERTQIIHHLTQAVVDRLF